MHKYIVAVTDDRHGSYCEEKDVLKEIDAVVEVYNLKSEEETIRILSNVDAVLVNLYPISARVIRGMKKCKVISRYGVGYDNVDVEAATKAKIWVARVPDYSLEDVSDHALALLLGCIRKIPYKDKRIREGGWGLKDEQPIHRINGRVLGLIGYGAIARTLHRKVKGLGLSNVLVFDPYIDPLGIDATGATSVDLNTLLRTSDYISIHVALTDKTKGMIGEKEIALMKREAIIINTSRGAVIDEKSLTTALKNGKINSAGLDVFEKEPLPYDSPLKKLDNVILSDHTGYYSEESIVELKTKAAKNVLEVFKTGRPLYPVNQI